MFKKENRLTKQKEFDNVFQNGISSFDKTIGIKTTPNNLKINRFGVIVSSKVSKKAVERNKIKRRLREVIKKYQQDIKSGFDVVVVALPSSKNKEFSSLVNSCYNHFQKLKLFE